MGGEHFKGRVSPTKDKLWTEKQTAVDRTNRWTDAQKIQAVAMYMEMSNCEKVSDITGIPVHTIRSWRMQPWWHEVEQRVLKEQDAEITSNFGRIVKKAQEKVLDRIENGDWIIAKSGLKQRKEMSGRDLTSVVTQGVTSRQLLLDRPTSRTETISTADRLKKLHDEFVKFSKAKTLPQEIPT